MPKTSLFGAYSRLVDEGIHFVLSLLIGLLGFHWGLTVGEFVFCLAIGLLVDVDHLIHPFLGKLLKIEGMTFSHSTHGYTFKLFHGFDVALILGFIINLYTGNWFLAICVFVSLVFHELWDFVVYPHSWKELFFVTRAWYRFKPGKRTKFVGKIFDLNSLKY